MDLCGNKKNKITGKKYQPVMSVTGLNDQGLNDIKIIGKKDLKKNKNYNYQQVLLSLIYLIRFTTLF